MEQLLNPLMKVASLVPLLLAFAGATADIPRHHRQRFLLERSTLAQELAVWKRSEAGQLALEHGYYTEPEAVQRRRHTEITCAVCSCPS